VLTIPLFTLPSVLRDRRMRWLMIAGAVALAATAAVTFFIPHYVAAITAIILATVVQGMRHLRIWRPGGKPTGVALVRWLVVACICLMPLRAWIAAVHRSSESPSDMGSRRASILARLEALMGRQLVIVRYKPEHDPLQEWVYNGADIDGSTVVWARDMGPHQNQELMQYYRSRHAWILDADEVPPTLSPCEQTAECELIETSAAGGQMNESK